VSCCFLQFRLPPGFHLPHGTNDLREGEACAVVSILLFALSTDAYLISAFRYLS
jgi:hypothetical protein